MSLLQLVLHLVLLVFSDSHSPHAISPPNFSRNSFDLSLQILVSYNCCLTDHQSLIMKLPETQFGFFRKLSFILSYQLRDI